MIPRAWRRGFRAVAELIRVDIKPYRKFGYNCPDKNVACFSACTFTKTERDPILRQVSDRRRTGNEEVI